MNVWLKSYKIFTFCAIIIILSLSSCAVEKNMKATESSSTLQSKINSTSKSSSSQSIITFDDIKNPQVIEETKYYKIIQGDNHKYYYYLFDENHDIVDEGGFEGRYPKISLIGDNIIKVSLQTGTGIDTSWSYYYNFKKDSLSRVFYGVYDEHDELIVYVDNNKKIIVRNMFDKQKYYNEFNDFKDKITDVASQIENIEFLDNGTRIKVTYLSNNDQHEVNEEKELN